MTGFIIFMLIAFVVLPIVPYWVVYAKGGQPGWASIVPIYNIIALLRMVKKPLSWFFLLCIPIVNIYFMIVVVNRLARSFGYGNGFTAGLIFLPFIFLLILAFSGDKYIPLAD